MHQKTDQELKQIAASVDFREGHIRDNADPDQLREYLLGAGLLIAELRQELQITKQAAADWRWRKFVIDRLQKEEAAEIERLRDQPAAWVPDLAPLCVDR